MIAVFMILFLCAMVMMVTEDDLPSKMLYGLGAIIFWVAFLFTIIPDKQEVEDIEYKVSIQLLKSDGQVIITNGVEIDTIYVDNIPFWINTQEL